MSGSETTYQFGPFRMEPDQRRLLRDGQPVPLTAKSFDTLLTLVRHNGQLVTKQALLRAVWPDVVVDEGNLTFTISILRRALGGSGNGRQYIETIPKQGYRFIAPLKDSAQSARGLQCQSFHWVVARDQQLRSLLEALERAHSGQPQARFISAEAGLGKTTLINLFASRIESDSEVLLAAGGCIDHKSQSEPYGPVLQALGILARSKHRELLSHVLRVHAPTWLAKMPSLCVPESRGNAVPPSQERMLREIEEALVALTENKTLVLVLEDLQWCDYSSLDFIARLLRIGSSARLMLIGSWRAAEARSRAHPIDPLIREACCRRPECLISLELLSLPAIQQMLSSRFDHRLAQTLAPVLYARTEGNPLFINVLVQYWRDSGRLRAEGGRWRLDAGEAPRDIPDTLKHFIEHQVGSLSPDQRDVLEAASVARPEAWLRVIAAALGRPLEAVERDCAALVQTGLMLRRASQFEYPNGDVGEAFEFTHGLYAEVIYSLTPPARCVRLHQRIGEFLEAAFASRLELVAGRLAAHFGRGRDSRRAIHYLTVAAERASCDGAFPNAVAHLAAALDLIPRLQDPAEREEAELSVQTLRGPVLIATKGFSNSEAEAALCRSLDLAERRGSSLQLRAVFGLAAMLEIRGEYRESQAVLERYLPAQQREGRYTPEWRHLLACSTFHQGRFSAALHHAEAGLSITRSEDSELLRGYGEHPRVECHTWAALALWFLGYPDRALAHAEAAAALIATPEFSYALANGSAQIAMVHQVRGDIGQSLKSAEMAVASGERQGMPYRVAIGNAIRGWARVRSGAGPEAIGQIRSALATCSRIGANLDRPYFLALLADALMHFGWTDEADAAIAQALEQIRASRSFFYEAELLRMRACILARRQQEEPARDVLRQAVQLAHAQGARSVELKALIDLVKISPGEVQALTMLKDTVALFSEGLDAPELRTAARLCGRSVVGHV